LLKKAALGDVMDASAWRVIYARFGGTASVEAFQTYQRWYEASRPSPRT